MFVFSDEEDDGSEDYSAGVDDFILAARRRHEERTQGEGKKNCLCLTDTQLCCQTQNIDKRCSIQK